MIVDDDTNSRFILKSLIDEIALLDCVQECASALQAFNVLQQQTVDLLFLDIEMPGMNGIEFLESLHPKPLTIICSSKTEYAFSAYENQAIDYLTKPIQEKRFLQAIQRAKEVLEKSKQHQVEEANQEFIFIRDNNLITKIKFEELFYIQAMGDYMKLITRDKFYVLHSTMKALESKLPASAFVRIHRSCIINIHHLDQIEDNIAYVLHTPLVIGESYKQPLLKRLNYL